MAVHPLIQCYKRDSSAPLPERFAVRAPEDVAHVLVLGAASEAKPQTLLWSLGHLATPSLPGIIGNVGVLSLRLVLSQFEAKSERARTFWGALGQLLKSDSPKKLEYDREVRVDDVLLNDGDPLVSSLCKLHRTLGHEVPSVGRDRIGKGTKRSLRASLACALIDYRSINESGTRAAAENDCCMSPGCQDRTAPIMTLQGQLESIVANCNLLEAAVFDAEDRRKIVLQIEQSLRSIIVLKTDFAARQALDSALVANARDGISCLLNEINPRYHAVLNGL